MNEYKGLLVDINRLLQFFVVLGSCYYVCMTGEVFVREHVYSRRTAGYQINDSEQYV